jgi:hypothetical protein
VNRWYISASKKNKPNQMCGDKFISFRQIG